MVSHPDYTNSSVSVHHRAASVTSRATSSHRKHHRHGRSHHGGSRHLPQNEFPVFSHTGDVEIVISAGGQEKRYLLHRLILAQCSGFFEAGTSEEWSRVQAQSQAQQGRPSQEMGLARIGEDDTDGLSSASTMIPPASLSRGPPPKQRWRYELDWDHTEDDEEPLLVQKALTSESLFGGDPIPPTPQPKPPSQGGFFRSMANLSLTPASTTHLPGSNPNDAPPTNEIVRDYDNLFRIFYNYAPFLNTTNIAAAYSESKTLLNLADMYDALTVVGPRIDHHLLRFSSRLFKQIAKYPPSYLRLGFLARSRIIFSEALIHVVGQWPLALPQLRNSTYDIPDQVLELIEDKVDEVDEAKSKVEARLFRLTLTTSRGERVTPSNAYLDWLAVSLFRQWLAENTTPPPQPILKNNNTSPPTSGGGGGGNHTSTTSSRTNNPRTTSTTNPPPPYSATATVPPSSPSRPATPLLNTGRIYRLLGSPSPSAYLPHDELKRFLKLHPAEAVYSRDNLRRFERRMEELKNLARDVVKPLMRNFLELDIGGEKDKGGSGGLPYLTCVRVEEDDLPWD
ncbi:MAG: hypothetical protein Q9227_001821 [Pyrenula ochraceoflavens]